MGNPYVGNAATFLITTAFGLYILIVMLRFVLQVVRADFYNPVSQFIVRATNPVLRPLRRYVPGAGGIDLASVLLMVVLNWFSKVGLSGFELRSYRMCSEEAKDKSSVLWR